MHTLKISDQVAARIIRRRGQLHIVDNIDFSRSALLMIDMQTAYLAEGQPGFSSNGVDMIPAANALVGECRQAGSTVIWIRNTLTEEGEHVWPSYDQLRTPEARVGMTRALAHGSEGHHISPLMSVDKNDLVIDKYRYSAFIQGSSDIDSHLRKRAIEILIIGGVLTNVCCESTARDAMMLNYRVVMAAEATAAHTDDEYNGSLTNILFAFGDVMTNAEIRARMMRQS